MINNIKKAFTLVELVIIISIIAILSFASVISYVSITGRSNETVLKQEINDVNNLFHRWFLEQYSNNKHNNVFEELEDFSDYLKGVGLLDGNPYFGNGYNFRISTPNYDESYIVDFVYIASSKYTSVINLDTENDFLTGKSKIDETVYKSYEDYLSINNLTERKKHDVLYRSSR